ncbi:Asp-tRNA(Asn)/Glu-tRNA(Gln) amidotransferase subunit GatC [bacterium]|nr:Asp-tRNA(Asn)/Glu-tRNA(Gln) amidotransferase subunit GatC [bacterium]
MISKKEVEHVAKLARLGLSEKEIEKMQAELGLILDYFELLKEPDISQVSPTFGAGIAPLENIMREDIVKKESPQTVGKITAQAPAKEKGHFKVKGVFG